MNNRAVLNYRIVLAIALVLLAIRLPLGQFFVSASDLTNENISMAINQERSQRSIPTLNYNTKLAAAADYKSRDMISRHYFSHTDPEGNYIWDKIAAEGYTPYIVLGENLAIDFSDTAGLVAAWIDSPTHRANILNPAFKDQGMAVAFGDTSAGQYSMAVTNTFGAQPAPVPAPASKTSPTTTTPPPTTKGTATTSTKPTATPTSSTLSTKPSQEIAQAPAEPLRTQASPVIDQSSVLITPNVASGVLNISIEAKVSGDPALVTATLLNKTIPLQSNNDSYSGTLTFEKYFNYRDSSLVLEADAANGNSDKYSVPLASYALPSKDNPKSFNSLGTKVAEPDLYNVFKYIVIIAGVLFLLFMLGDAFHFKKIKALANINIGSNLVIVFLLISTLLLVNWWH